MGSLRTSTTLLSATLALATGCTGTSTDNPFGGSGGGGGGETSSSGRCEAHSSVDLSPDEMSKLGFAPKDVLANAAGSHTETLHWSALTNASYGPESGTQDLTLAITSTGKARFVDYEPKASTGEFAVQCNDQVEIPVEVTLRSGKGALNERFITTLTATSARLGRVHYNLRREDIRGSLKISADGGYSLSELEIEIQATPFGLNGNITPSLTMSSGTASSQAASGVLAWWGLGSCEQGGVAVPADAKVADFSADQAMGQVVAHSSTSARWSSGDATTLTLGFDSSDQLVCAVLEQSAFAPPGADGPVGTLRIAGTLHATSEDAKLEANLRGTLVAVPDAGGKLDQVRFESDGSGAPDFTAVDLTGYDSTNVSSTLSLSGDGKWSGGITLTGYVNAACSSQSSSSQGGSSSSGCQGATAKDLAKLTAGE